jgi:hypothetical protein
MALCSARFVRFGFFTPLFLWEGLTMKRFYVIALFAIAAAIVGDSLVQAEVIVAGYYRLGEADAGAVAGNPVNATTTDSSGLGNNVNIVGSLTYSSDVAASAAASTGSTMSVSNPAVGYGYIAPPWTTATDNFGMEGWFKLSDVTSEQALAWNGNAASGNGWGLILNGGTVKAYYAGVAIWDSGFAPTLDEWFYVAMVRDNGVGSVYINSVTPAAETSTATPIAAAGISALCTAGGVEGMNGSLDEVRVFTFEAGAFNASTDLLYRVPEPSTLAMLAMSLIGLTAYAWRKPK